MNRGDLRMVLAHELAHYMGLNPKEHDKDPKNLMYDIVTLDAVKLKSGQGKQMKEHCFVQSGC